MPRNRSFIFSEFAKSLHVVYGNVFRSGGQYAALDPLGESAARGKPSCAGPTAPTPREKVDLERAIPVYVRRLRVSSKPSAPCLF